MRTCKYLSCYENHNTSHFEKSHIYVILFALERETIGGRLLGDYLQMRRWWSGQSQQTVNLSALAFAGSNPARRTRIKIAQALLEHIFCAKICAVTQ
jgi:hypothetical protein